MWKADLHNHLGSKGANPGFDATIDIVHNRLGDYSMFGIANSDDSRYESFVEHDLPCYGREYLENGMAVFVPSKKVMVVKCQEMFTNEGHILAIAVPYSKHIKSKTARDAIKEAKDLGAILCAVHTFYYQGIGKFLQENQELLSEFSTIETYNGSAEFSLPFFLPRDANILATEYHAKLQTRAKLDIGKCSFTDGHAVEVVGTCFTELRLENDFYNSKEGFVSELDKSLRRIKFNNGNLCQTSNAKDCANHMINLGMIKFGLKKD